MSKILVTGGAGFCGSNLAEFLLKQGHEVTIWDNLSTGRKENIPLGAEFLYLDISEKLPKRNFDIIFHLAALARIQPSFKNPIETHKVNLNGTLNILELARHTHAKVVYAGSSSFYHDPHVNPYSLTKWLGEEYCTMYSTVYNVPVAIARFFNVYGQHQIEEGDYATVIGIFERQKRNHEPLTVTGNGNKKRDFTHVDDIVRGLYAMSKKDYHGEIFNLGTGTNYAIGEVAHMFQPEKGIVFIPDRPGEAQTTLANIDFAKQELGYEPQVNLADYIARKISCQN